MSKLNRLRAAAPYWGVIALLWIVSAGVYIYHLLTGVTPDRVLFTLPLLELDVYWYGFLIMGGIALGSWVVSALAQEKAEALLRAQVPATIRNQPLAALDQASPAAVDGSLAMPAEIHRRLARQGIHNLGQLLLHWGFNPRNLGLNEAGRAEINQRLSQHPELQSAWLVNPPWRQWNPEHVWNGILWCTVLAIVGARLYHILTPSPSMAALGINSPADYFRNPMQLLNLRNGGLGIYGGLIGGAVGFFIYARRQHIRALPWTDLAGIGVALGQWVGRWGNFFNQELYGRPTDAPWAVTIEPAYRLPAYADNARFHPAFLYESLWNFLAFATLYLLYRRWGPRLRVGDLTALYLVFYAVGRILLEFVRLDSRTFAVGGVALPVATAVSLGIVALMILWRAWARRLPAVA